MTTHTIPAALTELAPTRTFIRTHAHAFGLSPAATDDLVQAVDEALTNIIIHGYRTTPDIASPAASGTITLSITTTATTLTVCLQDDAPPFDPTRLPPPDKTQRRLGGMGVYLVRTLVDQLTYEAPPSGGNKLYLSKQRSAEETT